MNRLCLSPHFTGKIINNLLLFTAQASTGKQGVLGPTKIYLAVQPSNPDVNNTAEITNSTSTLNQATNLHPPPLAPVQQHSPIGQTQIRVQNVVQAKQNAKVVVQPANLTQVF